MPRGSFPPPRSGCGSSCSSRWATAALVLAATAAASGTHMNDADVLVADMNRAVRHKRRDVVLHNTLGASSLPVGGDIFPLTVFWMFIDVGVPARQFPVQIDTGSMSLNIPKAGCSGCVATPPNNQYDPTASSTSAKVPCDKLCPGGMCVDGQCAWSNTYFTCNFANLSESCTFNGTWFTDEVGFGGASAAVPMGAITFQDANFDQETVIDGIMGFAMGWDRMTSAFQKLVDAGKVRENVFAMCFVEGKTSNGTITLGGVDRRLYTGDIQYVPNAFPAIYAMNLNGFAVNGKRAEGAVETAVMDSGTNLMVLPPDMYKGVRKAFEAVCTPGADLPGLCHTAHSIFDGTCYDYSAAQLAAFPNITIALDNGVVLRMDPRNYLLQGQPYKTADVYCLGIREGTGPTFILGDTLMENYYVVHDNENHRIGWADVNRDTCGSLGHL
eukprot:TRINITY_DN2610_c0_g1_i1.p1 TRINITY_DN2610_c0_g1~~TRINITY_DN2610_c0_g1_i1.p1  ORF type:complete len:442 (+),score=91.38 TRINITY_DN2610_c0_g1_i1:52-1377(+)